MPKGNRPGKGDLEPVPLDPDNPTADEAMDHCVWTHMNFDWEGSRRLYDEACRRRDLGLPPLTGEELDSVLPPAHLLAKNRSRTGIGNRE